MSSCRRSTGLQSRAFKDKKIINSHHFGRIRIRIRLHSNHKTTSQKQKSRKVDPTPEHTPRVHQTERPQLIFLTPPRTSERSQHNRPNPRIEAPTHQPSYEPIPIPSALHNLTTDNAGRRRPGQSYTYNLAFQAPHQTKFKELAPQPSTSNPADSPPLRHSRGSNTRAALAHSSAKLAFAAAAP